MNRFLVRSLVCVASAAAWASSASPKPERIYRKALPAVMTLDVENTAGERFVGSAVMGAEDDVAITAWHVVRDARAVWATYSDGTRIRSSGFIDHDELRDLALIKLEKRMPGRRIAISRTRPEVATRTFVVGSPKGYSFSISDGLLSQIRQIDGVMQYQVSCPISPGNSGGPVLNDHGQLIGITSWTKSDAQNLSFAIPIGEVDRLDARRPFEPWEKSSEETIHRIAARAESNQPQASVVADAAGYGDFSQRLQRSAGRRVTVIVQEDGAESRYDFVVPPKLAP